MQFSRSLGRRRRHGHRRNRSLLDALHLSPEAGEAFSRILAEGANALRELSASQHQAIQIGLGQAFRNAFLCTAAFASIAMYLTWSLPIRRV